MVDGVSRSATVTVYAASGTARAASARESLARIVGHLMPGGLDEAAAANAYLEQRPTLKLVA
jgi:hypothetical protein